MVGRLLRVFVGSSILVDSRGWHVLIVKIDRSA